VLYEFNNGTSAAYGLQGTEMKMSSCQMNLVQTDFLIVMKKSYEVLQKNARQSVENY